MALKIGFKTYRNWKDYFTYLMKLQKIACYTYYEEEVSRMNTVVWHEVAL